MFCVIQLLVLCTYYKDRDTLYVHTGMLILYDWIDWKSGTAVHVDRYSVPCLCSINQSINFEPSVLRLHQRSIGYLGDGFTGQKTQPTVSKRQGSVSQVKV